MFETMNKDMAMIVAIISLGAVCFFLYKENIKTREDISSCKSFSINLSNRIPATPPPKVVPAPIPDTDDSVTIEGEISP